MKGDEVLRKVDPSGSVSFAGTSCRVGNRYIYDRNPDYVPRISHSKRSMMKPPGKSSKATHVFNRSPIN